MQSRYRAAEMRKLRTKAPEWQCVIIEVHTLQIHRGRPGLRFAIRSIFRANKVGLKGDCLSVCLSKGS